MAYHRQAIKARPLPISRPWISPFHGLSATYKIQKHTHALIDLGPDLQEGQDGEFGAKISAIAICRGLLSLRDGTERLPRHRRLRQGWNFELARFPRHCGRCAVDAGDQSERLGGGANRT